MGGRTTYVCAVHRSLGPIDHLLHIKNANFYIFFLLERVVD